MKIPLRIILIIFAVLCLSFIIFFFQSSAVQYLAYYSFFAALIIVPLLWFFYCYKTLKKNILAKKPWTPFTTISSISLLVIFTILIWRGFKNATGMSGIGVFWLMIGFIVFLLLNVLIQLIMVNRIKKKVGSKIS